MPGLLVGPFILVTALTGVLYVLTPSWSPGSTPTSCTCRRPRSSPLADQARAALTTVPGGRIDAIRPAPEPGATTRVLTSEPGLGESERRTVFVDPGTGEIRGSLVSYGTSGVLPPRMAISQLHRNLLLGEPGRLYSELAASWMWVVALGGPALWVARRWRQPGQVSTLLRPATRGSDRDRVIGRHGALGAWLLAGMLFLSATGLTWSAHAGANIGELRSAVGWSTPTLSAGGSDHHAAAVAPTGGAALDPAAGAAAVDGVLGAARAAGIDASQIEVALPDEPGAAWTVTEIQRSWPTQVDAVAVDGGTGAILDEVRFARWGIDAHTGVLFGWVNQLLLVGFGIGLITLIVLGYLMWWRRRPTRGWVGRPVPRGQFRRAGQPVAFGLLAAAAIGWVAPVFGLSLLGFLVIDALLGRRSSAPSIIG